MRTLKKSLALVLALVMVLGLGVVGASADNALDDYKDLDKLDAQYVEAAGVMTGLGIINGIDAVTLDPDGTYTREQAAKIIAYMVLGADNAEAMTCTVAPFDDVPASHWSAKYINFCVNEGIIDGMSEDTFAPFDTLTGFQWAKMLLSAVGFNAKKELTGADWAIKTQSIASQTGLFNGDLKGGDHVALRREQAILYAFNTLTGIGCVTWSESLGDYFYTYTGVGSRFTYQGTLGAHVWNLYFIEGIVTDNEGMGATATKLEALTLADNTNPADAAYVKAGTGLDLYRHAVRQWYVGKVYSRTNAANLGTGVYTYDLAKSTVYKCDSAAAEKAIAAYKAAGKDISTGDFSLGGGKTYVISVIDNSAYAAAASDIYKVNFKVYQGTLGRTDKTAGTTTIDGSAVSSKLIKSDISGIALNAQVLILNVNNGKAYYMSPITSTTGAVKSLDLDTKAITLTDGTVLQQSALYVDAGQLKAIEDYLATPGVTTPAYTFTLDTHGHYMGIGHNTPVDVAYFTGATENVDGAWDQEDTYYAQFVNLTTGEPFKVQVTKDWYTQARAGQLDGKYYFDIHTGEFGESAVTPTEVHRGLSTVAPYENYVILKNDSAQWINVTVKSSDLVVTTDPVTKVSGGVTFNPATVNFVVGMGVGSNVKFTKYTGYEAMASALSAQYGVPVTSVTLTNAIAILDSTGTYATTIFAQGAVNTANGGYVYFTKPSNQWTVTDDGYFKAPAYLNGKETTVLVKADAANKAVVDAEGLYTYQINQNGYWTIADAKNVVKLTQDNNFTPAGGGLYKITNGSEYTADANTLVVYVPGAAGTKDPVTSMDQLYARVANNESFAVSFIANANGYISVMYVTAP